MEKHRGSCPDIDGEFAQQSEKKQSWLTAFNNVVKDEKVVSNTVSIAELRNKRDIQDVFGIRSNSGDRIITSAGEFNKSIICNGHDILALTSEDVKNMSLSDAHETLFQLRVEGNMMKKGFKRLRLWKMRYFILAGKMLSYWEVGNHNKMRHDAEITADCVIKLENIPRRPYAFSVLPNKTDRLYIIDALTEEQRNLWIQCIQVSMFLVRRVNSRATLRGLGTFMDHFTLGRVLGTGRYGIVRLAEHNDSMKSYAVKIINKKKVDRTLLKHELMIIRAVKPLNQENLLSINEVYEDEYLIYIVMEYLGGGDLYSRIRENGAFSEPEAARIIRHLARAVEVLHSNNILHLDIKPENIIYKDENSTSDMKLADFGCCLVLDGKEQKGTEIVGTAGYIAPEVLTVCLVCADNVKECLYSTKCDIYSLGVLLYILLMGYPPYKGNNTTSILRHTLAGDIDFNDDWDAVSPAAYQLVKSMLDMDPEKRPSIQDVLKSMWVNRPPNKRLRVSKSQQSLQMSLPSTLPGSKAFNAEDWLTPTGEDMDDGGELCSEDEKEMNEVEENKDASDEPIPSLAEVGPIANSVPYGYN